jgi:hypothetical protein
MVVKMSEKRFTLENGIIKDSIGNRCMSVDDVVDLLNEQQELIEELQVSDEMGWKRAEHFEKKCPKELHNKKMYIKRLEYKVQKFKEKNDEQQSTIEHLTKSRDRWSKSAKLHSEYFDCLEKAIEIAYEEKPYPKIEDIMTIYSKLEKEINDE